MRVLVFEPNNHHYEILPGYCKLLVDLGYTVDLLVKDHSKIGDEFCRADISVGMIHYDGDGYAALDKQLREEKYDFIFVSSFDHIVDLQLINVVENIEKINKDIPYIGCFHDLSDIDQYNNINLLKNRRIVTLSDYQHNGVSVPMVNPQYFCEKVDRHEKNNVTSFIMVGTNIWRNELEHALDSKRLKGTNFKIESIGAFDKKRYRKNRLKRKVFFPIARLFHISRYSNPNMKPASSNALRHITNVGKLPFPEMYRTIEKSDFILLNIKVNPNTDFITNKTSGSKQLALGFNKPPILPEKIAKAYGFDQTNAVIYSEGHLDDALLRACSLSKQEYQLMTRSLNALAERINKKSLDNLQKVIENILP